MEKEKYLADRPEHIKISITNICNYRCVMCPNVTFKQPRGFMEDELAYRIIDDCVASGIHRFSLGSSGEATLHKGFLTYLKYAKERGLWVSTATNCSQLTPEFSKQLFAIGIDRIQLSVYSATPEEHQNYCKKDNFEKVAHNIKSFLEQWDKSGRKADVKMGFLPLQDINDEKTFMEFWGPITRQYGLELGKKEIINWAGSMDLAGQPGMGKKWSLSREKGRLGLYLTRVVPCVQVPSYMYILHDGTVHPCCNFMDSTDHPEMRFGNIKDLSIVEAWQAPRFRRFREKHYQCDVQGFGPCIACDMRFQRTRITPSVVLRKIATALGGKK